MSDSKMQNIQRQQTILLLLALDGKVFSETLKRRFKVSDSIIFSDLMYLEKAGLLTRIEAGAVVIEECLEPAEK
ncbi:DeoR family transcriptional regulator [Marinomonas shanghaiensis]|uniref:DeoR family transcriptional regulator n=1 Tax=Marinomonas shanghaiensis TaxID=2202418 RepID=UPI000DB94C64|nr:DeoR family transcriptional regulator [Marinomonas shanghaiensis]